MLNLLRLPSSSSSFKQMPRLFTFSSCFVFPSRSSFSSLNNVLSSSSSFSSFCRLPRILTNSKNKNVYVYSNYSFPPVRYFAAKASSSQQTKVQSSSPSSSSPPPPPPFSSSKIQNKQQDTSPSRPSENILNLNEKKNVTKTQTNIPPSPPPSSSFSSVNISSSSPSNVFDVFIVGGGITGSALLYTLATFTDLKRVGLSERRDEFAIVASSGRNNSQTIHCGDIETNYSLEKAKKVKRQADMLRNFTTKLSDYHKHNCIAVYQKMALAVGSSECETLQKRYHTFKDTFPNMQLIGKEEIARMEPLVGMKDRYSYRDEEICAIAIQNEFSTIDFHQTAKCFAKFAAAASDNHKHVSIHMRTEVEEIEEAGEDMFKIITNKGVVYSRYVVVSACGNSLRIAQRMGYGRNFSCLPIAGSFYFTEKNVLNGKVYTVQNPALPFAAVHGDPDIIAKGKTRFGPTALPLPMLERYNLASIKDFLYVLNPDIDLVKVYLDLFKVPTIRNYVLKNFLYEVPVLNKMLFLEDVRKIIPSLRLEDISYAKGYGGVRPQLVDKKKRKLLLGEGKIKPDNVNLIFNVTPSPGATTCLGTAEEDMHLICKALNANVNEEKFKNTLLQGEYPVH